MNRLLICILLWFGLSLGNGQQRFTKMIWLADPACKPPACWYLRDSTVCDTVRCCINYRLTFIPDTLKPDPKTTVMVLEYTPSHVLYYSLAQRIRNRTRTRTVDRADVHSGNRDSPRDSVLKEFAGDANYINGEIWFDLKTRMLTERIADIARENLLHEYTEAIPDLHWRISGQTDSLFGYLCIRADCRFRGRDWTAWFTPEIPIAAGPWKLRGLPGLILKVQDRQKHYIWECDRIRYAAYPMIYHRVPTKKYAKEQFDRYVRNVHLHPYHAIDGGEGTTRIMTGGTSVRDFDPSGWVLPFNPLERE